MRVIKYFLLPRLLWGSDISKWSVARRIRHADNFSLLCERAANKFRGLKKHIFDIILYRGDRIDIVSRKSNLTSSSLIS
jgi:hypothetical protein